jgi:hypothetical protein
MSQLTADYVTSSSVGPNAAFCQLLRYVPAYVIQATPLLLCVSYLPQLPPSATTSGHTLSFTKLSGTLQLVVSYHASATAPATSYSLESHLELCEALQPRRSDEQRNITLIRHQLLRPCII